MFNKTFYAIIYSQKALNNWILEIHVKIYNFNIESHKAFWNRTRE